MRIKFFAIGLVLIFQISPSFATDQQKPHFSKITSVTVFPNMAQVTRTLEPVLQPGDHTLLLDHLPLKLLRDSVRIIGDANGEMTIGSVDVRKVIPKSNKISKTNISEEDRATIEGDRSSKTHQARGNGFSRPQNHIH